MTYLNHFHQEASEHKMRKIAVLNASPMSSEDAVAYMKRNFEQAKHLEEVDRVVNLFFYTTLLPSR